MKNSTTRLKIGFQGSPDDTTVGSGTLRDFRQLDSEIATKEETSLRHLLDDLTDAVSFRTSSDAHIKIVDDGCEGCSGKGCLYVCPANLFVLTADGSILFNYEGCFECGACAIACPSYVSWSYPTGGYGVSFKHG
ncbi:MAG: hypothetical protein M0T78_01445 [Actinomycetota bacterium]|jgi:ferredoxin like protein|nr:hypothetical protein [Actinomycetota bacterium]